MVTARRVLAVLIALRGLGNVLKTHTGTGLVVLGRLLPPDTPLAPALGVGMIVYAAALWRGRRVALALGVPYALFVTANVILFPTRTGLRPGIAPWMYDLYGVVALAVPWAAVWLLARAPGASRTSGRSRLPLP